MVAGRGHITEPSRVLDITIRHDICSLQERGKYTFYAGAITYNPARRRDFSQTVSTTSRILGHSSVAVTENAYLDLRHRYQNFSPMENMRL